jgi:hypothetical protein
MQVARLAADSGLYLAQLHRRMIHGGADHCDSIGRKRPSL